MKSRNSREGFYCGCMASPVGKRRCHVRSQTRQIGSGAATKTVTTRLVSKAEERHRIALVAQIIAEGRGDALTSANLEMDSKGELDRY